MNGWQLICRQLQQLGVEYVFGLPGTQNAEIFSELALANIRTITTSSEKSAAFAAIGHSVGTGFPSVLFTIAGPGFCFSAAPLVESKHDSVPLVNIVIDEPETPDRTFQLQQLDHSGIAERLVKAVLRIKSSADLLPAMEWGFRTAISGEPGPVVLFISRPILNEELQVSPFSLEDHRSSPSDATVDEIVEALSGKRVMLYVGRGAKDAVEEVQEFADTLGWPVMATGSGRGILPESHTKSLRVDNCNVNAINAVIAKFDIVLAIGVKFTHNGSMGYRLNLLEDKLIHVDASSDVLNANYTSRINVCSDARAFCRKLLRGLQKRHEDSNADDLQTVIDTLEAGRPDTSLEPEFQGEFPTARAFFGALQEALPADTFYVSDSGYHQVLARRHLRAFFPNQLLFPSDFQSMGFGLPAGIGLALANPGRTVVVIHGDGGFQMTAMDMLTIVRYDLRILVCVLDDGYYGLIRKQQLSSGDLPSGVKLTVPNYEDLANAVGIRYRECLSKQLLQELGGSRPGLPILMRQPISDSKKRRSRNLTSQSKGRVRRLLGPKLVRLLRTMRRG